ncbi:GNAT family N-acetyltransferase [Budvicia aquatica]|uniref:GNAT family N-acetyltransferase n=1 Tax=Budvicia aquatica TaxID=82979 RepID=A0A2C6DPD2_9GAMM|nr:GNAT family N-acetyltransferase [Budvicia aquatica]PHI30661.1 GNAT family N-acetyltransferase [Budvicia aquatica]
MNTFSVRRISRCELDEFRSVRLEALRLHPNAFGASYEDWCQKPTEFFAERIDTDNVFGGFDSENKLQGIIGISCSTTPKLRHVATIWGMYVRAEMRGTGLAKLLMKAALEAANSVSTVKLSVATTNYPAQALYRSFGFREWAIDVAALYVDGVFYDELLMRLDLKADECSKKPLFDGNLL